MLYVIIIHGLNRAQLYSLLYSLPERVHCGVGTTNWTGGRPGRVGPIVEAHDHSGELGKPTGLFGFIGWPSQVRHINADTLQSAIITQLVRSFGEEARTPDYFHIEDWAENPFVCAPTDITEPPQHPQLAPSLLRKPFLDDRVFLAVAELARVSPGLTLDNFNFDIAPGKSLGM